MADGNSTQVVVTQIIEAPPEEVFDAFLDPEKVGIWMGKELNHVGEYLELERPRKLVFTWGIKSHDAGSRVQVDLAFSVSDTRVTLTHELKSESAGYEASVRDSWSKMLGVLAELLRAE